MNKNDGIVMFKDTFEYIVNGELTPEESVLLMKLIYDFKWLDICPEDSDISSKSVRLIWKTLKHTINRSKQNQRAYNNRIGNKTFSDSQETDRIAIDPTRSVKTPIINKTRMKSSNNE